MAPNDDQIRPRGQPELRVRLRELLINVLTAVLAVADVYRMTDSREIQELHGPAGESLEARRQPHPADHHRSVVARHVPSVENA